MNNKIEPSDIIVVWALVMKLKDRALFADLTKTNTMRFVPVIRI